MAVKRITTESLDDLRSNSVLGDGGCWLWKHGKTKGGYGTVHWHGRTTRVHRLAAHFAFGMLLNDSRLVMHSCDIRHCVNPDHLSLGESIDNVRDMMRKKRATKAIGENHGNNKYPATAVLEIRKLWEEGRFTKRQIADQIGVPMSCVRELLLYRGWKHITPLPTSKKARKR